MAGNGRLVIPELKTEGFTVTIESLTPLLCNRFSKEKLGQIKRKQAGMPSGPRAPKDPEAEYLNSIYRMRDDSPGFPAGGIKKASVSACRHIDGVTMAKTKGSFYIFGDLDNLVPIKGEPEIFEHPVVVQRRADIRYRAIFPEWSITFDVMYEVGDISMESILNLIERGGFHVGIGDWRPEKNGTFGMFRVARG